MTTRLRYEVWVNMIGPCSRWKRLPHNVFVSEPEFNEVVKQNALARASALAEAYAKVCVEEYDDERDVFLRTVIEYPVK